MPDNGPMPTEPTVPAAGASAAAASRSRRWPVVTAVTVLMALYAGLVVAYAVSGASAVDQALVEVPAGGVRVTWSPCRRTPT